MLPDDLASPEFRSDPYPVYRRLREEEPCLRLPGAGLTPGLWLVTRYADVERALRDPLLSKDLARVVPPERLSPLDRSMISRDAPDHARLRSLVGQAFTPARVEGLEPFMEAAAEELLSSFEGAGGGDFVSGVAVPFPVAVLAELLGIGAEDHASFREWSGTFLRDSDATVADEASRRRQREALRSLGAYLSGLIARRRREPRDDLVSSLLEARDRDDRLTEQELLGTCLLLLLAGAETTVHLLGNGLLTLLRHPGEMARLREDPSRIPRALEEVLRFESPVQRATFRVTAAEVEIAGRRIPEGEQVSAVIGAANRDPDHFPDPDRFDGEREPNRHLSFGMGPHYCLGASLARAEARVLFRQLLRRFPDLRLSGEPEWSPSSVVRGLRSLPLRTRG